MNFKKLPTVSQFYSDAVTNKNVNRASGNIHHPKKVVSVRGCIKNANALTVGDDSCAIVSSFDQPKPYIVLDMGKSSVGGYAVFRVKRVSRQVTLRLSFTNWYDHIVDTKYGEIGDYIRGSCKYLGVELPILPADPHRFEIFTVSQPGLYFFPLLQGQLRWVRLQLDTPDAEIEISQFRIENHENYDTSDPLGYFDCDIEDYNRVWQASVWTAQLASIPNNDAWTDLCGYILPRYIDKADPIGYLKDFNSKDHSFSFTGRISFNPSVSSAMGFAFNVKDGQNGIVGKISLDGTLELSLFKDGKKDLLFKADKLPVKIIDNLDFKIEIAVRDANAEISIDGVTVCRLEGIERSGGSVGFYSEKEMWYAVKDICIDGCKKDDLSLWKYCKTLGYLSDGAMRDRLLWTGDISFASRNIYYAADPQYIRSSIYMMMQNQTEEGYVNPSPYPANKVKPKNDDYGPFPSSEFSAWFAPIVAEYVKYTADIQVAKDSFDAVKRNLEFICRDIDGKDGLFHTSYALSKNIFALSLGNEGKYSYTNVLAFIAFKSGVYLARLLGKSEYTKKWERMADDLRRAVQSKLFDSENNTLVLKSDSDEPAEFSNAFAILCGMFDKDTAANLPLDSDGAGKLLGMSIRAMLELYRDGEAFGRLRNGSINVNWIDAQNDWRHPATISECMHYPETASTGENWNDKSHPDAAIADIFSAYLLGVKIADTGFGRINIAPHFLDARYARGIIPTPHGEIKFSWEITVCNGCEWRAFLSVCEGTVADMKIPVTGGQFKACISGGDGLGLETAQDESFYYIKNIPAGEYEIYTVSGGEIYKAYLNDLKHNLTGNNNSEYIDFSISSVSSNGDDSKLIWNSSCEDKTPWIELDMGREQRIAGLSLFAPTDGSSILKDFSVTVCTEDRNNSETIEFREMKFGDDGIMEVDLFTVLGLLKGRYIKITAFDYSESEAYGVRLSDIRIR